MNKFIQAVVDLNFDLIREMTSNNSKWFNWSEPSGKNALHYLSKTRVDGDEEKAELTVEVLKFLLEGGMNVNSVHRIEEKCGYFPATPLWYAYTHGRNEKLYRYLLKAGATPENCMWAMAWNDDVEAAKLFIKYGAKLDDKPSLDELFLGAFQWKRYKFANWLLNNGANVNASDGQGNTALMMAVKRKDEEVITNLLKIGADSSQPNNQGISARKLAELKAPKRISRLFETI